LRVSPTSFASSRPVAFRIPFQKAGKQLKGQRKQQLDFFSRALTALLLGDFFQFFVCPNGNLNPAVLCTAFGGNVVCHWLRGPETLYRTVSLNKDLLMNGPS